MYVGKVATYYYKNIEVSLHRIWESEISKVAILFKDLHSIIQIQDIEVMSQRSIRGEIAPLFNYKNWIQRSKTCIQCV